MKIKLIKKQEIINIGLNIGLNIKDINDIILKITGLSKIQLFLINNIENKYVNKIIQKYSNRKNGYPIEYIINKADFFGLDFFVDKRVLIPRNDTELMIEQVLKIINSPANSSYFTLIDIGTGSGNIPISIIKNSTSVKKSYITEISKEALNVCKINIKNHNLEDKIIAINGELLSPIIPFIKKEKYNTLIITANLPYIKDNNYSDMDKEVILFEPPVALYGGKKTGFELYEKLIEQIFQIIPFSFVILFIEIGFDQYDYSKKFLDSQKLKYTYFKDNNGIERCIKIEF